MDVSLLQLNEEPSRLLVPNTYTQKKHNKSGMTPNTNQTESKNTSSNLLPFPENPKIILGKKKWMVSCDLVFRRETRNAKTWTYEYVFQVGKVHGPSHNPSPLDGCKGQCLGRCGFQHVSKGMYTKHVFLFNIQKYMCMYIHKITYISCIKYVYRYILRYTEWIVNNETYHVNIYIYIWSKKIKN